MAEQGSAGNVIAALASFFVPGLGQLIQGRLIAALFFLVMTGIIWLITFTTLGWVGHVWAAFDAAIWRR